MGSTVNSQASTQQQQQQQHTPPSIECGGNVETSWGALSIARPQHNNNNNNNNMHDTPSLVLDDSGV